MTRRHWWIAVAFLGVLAPGAARAACTLGLDVQGVVMTYDFFLGSASTQAVEIEVTHQAGDSCPFFVTVSRGGANDYDRRMTSGSNTLPYQIYSQANQTGVLKELADATMPLDVLAGNVSPADASPRLLTCHVVIPAHQVRSAGVYGDTVTVTLYQGELDGEHTLVAATGMSLSTTLAQDIEMSLADTGHEFDATDTSQSLDFGVLELGESLGFDLMVRSNAGYTVTMVSENQGRLKLEGAQARDNTTVAYALTVDGLVQDLSGTQPVEVASGVGVTEVGGVRHPVNVTIGSVSGKIAGSYEDNITITAVTAE